jgi:hypothetical protein
MQAKKSKRAILLITPPPEGKDQTCKKAARDRFFKRVSRAVALEAMLACDAAG